MSNPMQLLELLFLAKYFTSKKKVDICSYHYNRWCMNLFLDIHKTPFSSILGENLSLDLP